MAEFKLITGDLINLIGHQINLIRDLINLIGDQIDNIRNLKNLIGDLMHLIGDLINRIGDQHNHMYIIVDGTESEIFLRYFPGKGVLDSSAPLAPSPPLHKKNLQNCFFSILDNKMNFTPKTLFIFNRAGCVLLG